MEEGLKTRFLVISVILNIIFILSSLGLGSNSSKNWNKYQQELKSRIEAEESLANFNREKSSLEDKLKIKEEELNSAKKENLQLNRIIGETQDKLKQLEEEYNKLLSLKLVLEEDLKNALVKTGVPKVQVIKQPKN
jgi:hypothetical protein